MTLGHRKLISMIKIMEIIGLQTLKEILVFCILIYKSFFEELQMYKVLLVSLLALFTVAEAGECFGSDCQFRSPSLTPAERQSPAASARSIQQELRRSHWYYLRNTYLDTNFRNIFFFQHQSVVGTFLAIVSLNKQSGISSLETLVKIGEGLSEEPRYGGNLPQIRGFKLSAGESIELAEQGDLNIQSNIRQINLLAERPQSCLNRADTYLKRTYWYYLRGAPIIHQRSISTATKQYEILTYVNIVGTFLVIAECQGQQIKANTFVRLGRGGAASPAPQLNL